ncbi:MAG TPA: tetratricopeptide repeat protein [Myxococcaceae bacterium]|nr:tetratricopeptide repeat protein [Myxococcaceae bacterium]
MIGVVLALALSQTPEQVAGVRKLEKEGNELLRAGHYADAEKSFQAAVDLWTKYRGPDDVEVLDDSMTLAVVRRRRGDFEGAVVLLQKVFEGLSRCKDPDAPQLRRRATNDLAASYKYAGQPKKAQVAWEGLLKILPADAAEERAVVLDNLAILLLDDLKDLAGAEKYAKQGYAAWRALRGEGDDPDVAISETTLGTIALRKGDRKEARRLLADAVRVLEASGGADSPNVAAALNLLSDVEEVEGHRDAARADLERSLAISRKLNLDSKHYLVVDAKQRLQRLDAPDAGRR